MAILPPTPQNLSACCDRLKAGGLIGLPTETVYGLAADATNASALAALYATKARPNFNPLITHVADLETARGLGRFNAVAEKLAAAFWPGPLTLVVPRSADCAIDLLASAGLDSLALRCPAHPVAQALLQQLQKPLAAPSANPSGRLSPSRAEHVANMLPDIDILDGGASTVGLESSIVGCLQETPVWLRSGGISRHDVEACLGFKIDDLPDEADATAKLAPGRLARHYAPKAKLVLNVNTLEDDRLLLGFGADAPHGAAANLSPSGDLAEAASQLFAQLHDLDAMAVAQNKHIGVMPIPQHGLGEAINDRLTRAAAN
ncbi:L-threonylcarbamoyladenylate synthase [bacterium]|nr:L-threonylcarbamoyladenylate synthase [bacterium]